jgi:hypothetical protein
MLAYEFPLTFINKEFTLVIVFTVVEFYHHYPATVRYTSPYLFIEKSTYIVYSFVKTNHSSIWRTSN